MENIYSLQKPNIPSIHHHPTALPLFPPSTFPSMGPLPQPRPKGQQICDYIPAPPPEGHTSALPPHPWTSRLPFPCPESWGARGSSPVAGLLNSPLAPACWPLVSPSLCGLLLLNSSLTCSSFPVLNALISSVSVVSTADVSLENLSVDIPMLISLWRAGREHPAVAVVHPAVAVVLPMSVPRAQSRAAQSSAEQRRAEQSRAAQSRAAQSSAEQRRAAPLHVVDTSH